MVRMKFKSGIVWLQYSVVKLAPPVYSVACVGVVLDMTMVTVAIKAARIVDKVMIVALIVGLTAGAFAIVVC